MGYFDNIIKSQTLAEDPKLEQFKQEISSYKEALRKEAVNAFNHNSRKKCAVYYTLYAISMNANFISLPIMNFVLKQLFHSNELSSISIDEKSCDLDNIIHSISTRTYGCGCIGWELDRINLSNVQNRNLPFTNDPSGCFITFFDFIGICKNDEKWPDIRLINK